MHEVLFVRLLLFSSRHQPQTMHRGINRQIVHRTKSFLSRLRLCLATLRILLCCFYNAHLGNAANLTGQGHSIIVHATTSSIGDQILFGNSERVLYCGLRFCGSEAPPRRSWVWTPLSANPTEIIYPLLLLKKNHFTMNITHPNH